MLNILKYIKINGDNIVRVTETENKKDCNLSRMASFRIINGKIGNYINQSTSIYLALDSNKNYCLDIYSKNGYILLKNFSGDIINIGTAKGKVSISNCCLNELNISSSTYGETDICNLIAKKVNIKTHNKGIKIDNCIANKINIESVKGKITLKNVAANDSLILASEDGMISADNLATYFIQAHTDYSDIILKNIYTEDSDIESLCQNIEIKAIKGSTINAYSAFGKKNITYIKK